MTTADLKRAFMDERPVRYNGITYQRVTAVIYRKTPDKTGLLVQGELLDKNGRAVRAGRLGLQQSAGKRAGPNLPGVRPAVVLHYATCYLGRGHNAIFDLGV